MYIRKGPMLAHVTDQGGSVNFWAHGENTILGPVRQVETSDGLRLRGDSHWCFPLLGSPPAGELFQGWPKHGQLRHLDMTPQRSACDLVAYGGELRLEPVGWICGLSTITGLFEGSDGSPDKLDINLVISNVSRPIAPRMPVLPALHAYFNVAGGAVLKFGGQAIDFGIGTFGPMVVQRVDPIMLELAFGQVTICPSSNCQQVVVWTDRACEYLCIEPVFGGAPGSFNAPEGHTLGNLDIMYCSATFQFAPV